MYLQHDHRLTPVYDQLAASTDLGVRRRTVPAGADLIIEGEPTEAIYVLVDGWAAPYRLFEDGRRQVMAVLIPGDYCHIELLGDEAPLYSVSAITNCIIDVFPRAAIGELLMRYPELSRSLWSQTMASVGIQLEWMVNLGRRTATERLGHLFCEIFHRVRLIGGVQGNACDFPLTQVDLADSVGLTPVHLNRTLQALRSRGLVVLERRRLVIPDLARLAGASMFDSRYLDTSAGRIRPIKAVASYS